jgi:hypothetical protein
MPINDDLEKIAQLQGRVVPRGDFIAGFGSGDPPAPAEIPSAREAYGPPIEPPRNSDPEPEAFDDELLPMPTETQHGYIRPAENSPVAVRRAPVGKFSLETPDLTVLGADAAFQEHRVKLLDSEVGQIKNVVLRALQRVLKERLVEVGKVLPKRKRRGRSTQMAAAVSGGSRSRGGDGSSPGMPSIEPAAPKKRGRPRKVKP